MQERAAQRTQTTSANRAYRHPLQRWYGALLTIALLAMAAAPARPAPTTQPSPDRVSPDRVSPDRVSPDRVSPGHRRAVPAAKAPTSRAKMPTSRAKMPTSRAKMPTSRAKTPTSRAKTPINRKKTPTSRSKTPTSRAKKPQEALPGGVGPIDFPPLPKRKVRKRRKRRPPPPLVIPKITKEITQSKEKLGLIIAQLRIKHWRLQYEIVKQLSKAGGQTTEALHKALTHKHLRVRLLVAQALAMRRDMAALPMLLQESRRLYDQPSSLLMGAWLAYGDKVIPDLQKAVAQGGNVHIYLRALGLLRARSALPLLARYALHPQQTLRIEAREALQAYSTQEMVGALEAALAQPSGKGKQRGTEKARAALVRMFAYRLSAEGMGLLVKQLQARSTSIRFLARITLEDQAQKLHKALPRQIAAPPKTNEGWVRWWQQHKGVVGNWYKTQRSQTQLDAIPAQSYRQVRLLYQTVHPVFGYGRMPLLIHDAAWKKPPPPQKGKLWYVPLPSKEFAALLRRVQHSGFFQWPTRMGHVRDITVYVGRKHRRVSMGLTRFLPFEQLERAFLQLAKRQKLGLHFEDFYKRLDEADLTKEGQIGQWAFRSGDRQPKRAWHPSKDWTPGAEIEGFYKALRDLIRYLPSRTRLIAIDGRDDHLRISTLLFGSRSQSRLTREGALRSRRLHQFKLISLGNIYLSGDKIEEMIFELHRRPFPWRSRSSPRKGPDIAWLRLFQKVWPVQSNRLVALKYQQGRPHRLLATWKTHSSYTLLQSLAQLAAHSRGDRLLALRINASGMADRSQYPLIVQMQWEMTTPVAAPSRLPSFLQPGKKSSHEPFSPVYR